MYQLLGGFVFTFVSYLVFCDQSDDIVGGYLGILAESATKIDVVSTQVDMSKLVCFENQWLESTVRLYWQYIFPITVDNNKAAFYLSHTGSNPMCVQPALPPQHINTHRYTTQTQSTCTASLTRLPSAVSPWCIAGSGL